MPALLDIERSEAMVSWNRARALVDAGALRGSGPNAECGWTPLSGLSDDELVGQVRWWDRQRPSEFDAPPIRFEERLDTLARELALRVARDPHLADRLVGLAGTHPLIGSLTGRARFPVEFTSRVVTAMVRPGPVATADFDHYAEALSVALTALVSDPAACLDLLLDPVVLHGIAGSRRLDPEAVHEFVLSGLHTSVLADPARLADGYRVLAHLTSITNGPLDDGIHQGWHSGSPGRWSATSTRSPRRSARRVPTPSWSPVTASRSSSARTTRSSTCSARSCATRRPRRRSGSCSAGTSRRS